jgi:CPA2 family monovalent cation:H+ antiporter-2
LIHGPSRRVIWDGLFFVHGGRESAVTAKIVAHELTLNKVESAGMEGNPILFRDLTYIFVAAVIGGLVAWKLRLPLILGFILGGIAVSPFTPGPHLSDAHNFEVLAETGVVLLMFSVGAEFSIPELMRVKWVALIGAPVGILLQIGVATQAAKLLGWSYAEGAVIGATISVASTMVMVRLLTDLGKMNSSFAHVMLGITVVEDLAVVCMTVVFPILGGHGDGRLAAAAWTIGKALALLIPLIFTAWRMIPHLMRLVGRTADPELLLLVSIAVCMGTAALTEAAGFSLALGAFLAGLSISGSDDLRAAHAKLVPLRDAFGALFFVSLGILIEPTLLAGNLRLLGLVLLLIIVGKFVVWSAIVWLFRYPTRTAVVAAAGLTQIGELSFVVAQAGRSAGIVAGSAFTTVIAASLISILLNVFIVRGILRFLARKSSDRSLRARLPQAQSPLGGDLKSPHYKSQTSGTML